MKSYTTPSFKFVGRGTGVKVKEQVKVKDGKAIVPLNARRILMFTFPLECFCLDSGVF